MRKWLLFLLALIASPVAAYADEDAHASVTFAEQIAPLVFDNCTTCHRPGQAAPFALLTYADARKHAKTMLRVMQERYMPPWQPEPGHGAFRGERRLTDAQIALFEHWVKSGMAEGDAKRTPALPKFPEGWRLGQPDLIVQMDRPFDFPAQSQDVYRNFVLPLNLSEDKWVTAVEFRASAPEVVHHVLYFLDSTGAAQARTSKTGEPGFSGMAFRRTGSLGGWAVGATPVKLPEGLAMPLHKGSDLVLQTHFHATGKLVHETLTVGLYFASKPPQRTLVNLALPPAFGLFSNLDIPAGQAEYRVDDSFTLPVAVDLVGVGAHAHYLGKTMRATAKLPDGTKDLFWIRDWDFNWQGLYLYKDFVRLPKGAVIHAEVTWDNSGSNPRNPTSPPARVRWGEATTDEMGQVGFLMVAANQAETSQLREALQAHMRQAAIRSRMRGDKIDWAKLGVEPPALLRNLLGGQQKKETKTPPLSFRDLDGKEQTPLAVERAKAHVLIFLTTECPISDSYAPEISALVKEYAPQSVRFFAIQISPDLTPEAARKHNQEFGLTLPTLLDTKHQLVAATGATCTPEVAVLLPDGKLAYRGRIDDRYPELGKDRRTATRHDLREALTAILASQPVREARTEGVGCFIPELP